MTALDVSNLRVTFSLMLGSKGYVTTLIKDAFNLPEKQNASLAYCSTPGAGGTKGEELTTR